MRKKTIALLKESRDRYMFTCRDRDTQEEQQAYRAKLREFDDAIVALGGELPKSPPPGTDTGGYFY